METGGWRLSLYQYKNLEIYPGTLEERSIERVGEDKATEIRIAYDIRLGGPLVEEFPDAEYKKDDFKWKTGRQIYGLLRRILIMQGRIGDPIPNHELERVAISEGFQRLHARMALRDAWKMGLLRRFIRGKFAWGSRSKTVNGKSFGVHYILRGQQNG